MNKAFENFTWQNEPKVDTPLSADNLNRVNRAVNEIDNRVITLDITKASATDIQKSIISVEFEENTGVLRFTHKDGSSIRIDTKLEKIPFEYELDAETQQIVITNTDGTKQSIDIGSFITIFEFLSSDTIAPVISGNKVSFEIVKGSVSDEYIEPNYLAKLKVEANRSEIASASAEASAKRAEDAAGKAQVIAKFEIDTVLDENSYNPISNRPVALELKKKVESIPAVDFNEAKKPEFIQSAQELVKSVTELRDNLVSTNNRIDVQGLAIKQNTEALDNRIKKFYTSNLGETHITDSDDGVFRNIVIGGKSEQKSDPNFLTMTDYTGESSGLSIVRNTDGSVVLNGTSTEGTAFFLNKAMVYPDVNRTYALSIGTVINGVYTAYSTGIPNKLAMGFTNSTTMHGVQELTPSSQPDYDAVLLSIIAGASFDNEIFYPMVHYKGDMPRPIGQTPEYQIEIESVDNATAVVNGSNLLDLSGATSTRATFDIEGDGKEIVVSTTNRYGTMVIPVNHLKGKTVKFAYDTARFVADSENKATFVVQFWTTNADGTNSYWHKRNEAFTIPADAQDAQLQVSANNTASDLSSTATLTVEGLRILEADVDSPWMPYVPEQLAPIPFTLRSVGEGENAVRDVMYVYADGMGKLVQRVGVATNLSAVGIDTSGKLGQLEGLSAMNLPVSIINNNVPSMLCNMFVSKSLADSRKADFAITQYMQTMYIRVGSIEQTVDAYNEWLSNHNMVIQYPLATPIETALTAEQVKALFELRTHYGGTNISFTTENGVEPSINFDYACSLENFVEYVKGQMGDDRKFIYDMDDRLTDSEYMTALAYVNSEYATALAELGV